MHNVQLPLCIAIFMLQSDVNAYIMDMYVCTSFVKVQISHIKSTMSLIISLLVPKIVPRLQENKLAQSQ